MQNIKTILAVGVPLCLLGACSSVPQNVSNYASSSETGETVADANMAVITIARNEDNAKYLTARVLVDGNEVGLINNRQSLSIPVAPGSRHIKLKFKSGTLRPTNSVTLNAEAGETYIYKFISTTQGGIGGYYGAHLSTTYRLLAATTDYVNACCDMTAAP